MASLGGRLFAIAIIAFGIQQFFYGDFVPGRAPAFPAQWPGRSLWAYSTGMVFILSGGAILAGRQLRTAGLTIALLIFAWALLRNAPGAVADPTFGAAWTRVGKALALSGGGLAVAGLAWQRDARAADGRLLMAGQVALAIFLVNSGIQHFLFPGAVMTLVPAWMPGPRAVAYGAGVALIAGGAGIVIRQTRALASGSVAAMIFSWFLVLHIPRALAAAPANQRNEWIAVFEALAFSGLALVAGARTTKS